MAKEANASSQRRHSSHRLEHVPKLDGLRGVAVLLVVLFHSTGLANPVTGVLFSNTLLNGFALGGFMGVDMFFVLSGFLITSLLLRERADHGSVNLGSFYRRRAFRLLPALLVLIAAHFVYAGYVHLSSHREVTSAVAAMLYVFNYATAWHPTVVVLPDLIHLWSLSVEEQFYLFWPFLLLFLLRGRRFVVPAAIVAAIVAVMVQRVFLWNRILNPLAVFVRTDARADSLLVGALLAWAWVHGYTPTRGLRIAGWLAAAIVVGAIGIERQDSSALYYGGFTLFAIAVAVVILAIVSTDWGRTLEWRPLRAVGRVSYGLYLWHGAIFVALLRYGHPHDKWERILLGLALSALATWLSWVLVERRAIAFGRASASRPKVETR